MTIRQIYWHNCEHTHMQEDSFRYCPLCGKLLVQTVVDNLLRRTCSDCGYVHFRNPAPTVSLLVINGGFVLLGKRTGRSDKDAWATPSGYIEFNENFLDTAIRETKEETGLDIQLLSILQITDSFFPPEQHFLNIYLLARVIGGQIKAGDDMDELGWFPIAEPLPKMTFQEDVDLIDQYFKGNNQYLTVEQGKGKESLLQD